MQLSGILAAKLYVCIGFELCQRVISLMKRLFIDELRERQRALGILIRSRNDLLYPCHDRWLIEFFVR